MVLSTCWPTAIGGSLPSFAAGLVAFVVGWMADESLQSLLGVGPTLLVSLTGSTAVFFYVRKKLRELRGD